MGQGGASPLGHRGASCSLCGLFPPPGCVALSCGVRVFERLYGSLEKWRVLPRVKDAGITSEVKIDDRSDAGHVRWSVMSAPVPE